MPEELPPLTLDHIEDTLRRAINKQRTLVAQYKVTAEEMGRTEALFKTEFAKRRFLARLDGSVGVKMTSDLADDIAVKDTAEYRFAMESAAAIHDATRQELLSERTIIEALRSLMASYREGGGA